MQDVFLTDEATNMDMFYVEGIIYEPLAPFIGSSGDPYGTGSHHDYMVFDHTGNSIKVTDVNFLVDIILQNVVVCDTRLRT